MTIRECLEQLKGQYTDYEVYESKHHSVNRLVNDYFYRANMSILYDEDAVDDERYEVVDTDILDWEEENAWYGWDFEESDDKILLILVREKWEDEEGDEEE